MLSFLMCSFKYLGILQKMLFCVNADILLDELLFVATVSFDRNQRFQPHVRVTANSFLSTATSTHFCWLTNSDRQ